MSDRDSGCAIFCCLRRPKTPAKKALDEDSTLNLNDVEATHGANNIESEASNLTLDVSKESQERNSRNVRSTTDVDESTETEQSGGKTNETITEAPSSQSEPLSLESVNFGALTSPPCAKNVEGGDEGIKNGELCIEDVTIKIHDAQLDADEENLAQLEQLVKRLEAVADALETEKSSTGRDDGIASGILIDQAESFNSGEGDAPSCVLDGSEWIVANHHDNKELLVHMIDDHQNVRIRNCHGCTIQIDGKPDIVSIGDCVKCGVVFRDVATSINVSNCQRLQIQGLGIVPCIYAKNTDGLSIYVSRDCPEVPVFSFKCSELNMLVPSDRGDGDFQEVSVPEQFRSHWNGDSFRTEVADIVA